MHKFPTVDIKGSLIWLVGDAVPYSFAKHGLVAAHVIVHNVFKIGHECLLIDEIKVNQLIGGNLNSDVTFNVIDEASHLQSMIEFPAFDFGHFVDHLFKEVNFVRTSDDQSFAAKHYHLSEVFVNDLLCFEIVWLRRLDHKRQSLSIKQIYFLSRFAEKALIRKILKITIYDHASKLALNSSFGAVPEEMMVCSRVVMENTNENGRIIDEATSSKRVWEFFVCHGVIIKAFSIISYHGVDINFIIGDFLSCSRYFPKLSEIPSSIVKIENTKLSSMLVLFDFFTFDI